MNGAQVRFRQHHIAQGIWSPAQFFSALLSLLLLNVASGSTTEFEFPLARAATTSAGVYNSSGVLVRTLWSGRSYRTGGTYSSEWDNFDDLGNPAPAGTYSIKVLAHNVNHVWEGVVGNTSALKSGSGKHSALNIPTSLCFVGSTGVYTTGYSEISPPFRSFVDSNPQVSIAQFSGAANNGNGYDYYYSAGDESRVYFACTGSQNPSTNLMTMPGAISAFNPVTGAVSPFTSGYPIYQQHHPFTNGVRVGTQPGLSGLAAQKGGGSFLAASVTADNAVYLLDKVSGSVVRSFSVPAPGALAFDNNNTLWVVSGTSIRNYNNLSSAPTLVRTISGFAKPLALAVSPANAPQPNLLLVADGGASQQVKAYDLLGNSQWTLGQAGGYASGPNVTLDKFWFNNPDYGIPMEQSSLAFQADGQFWLIDSMNCRMLRFQLSETPGALPAYQTQIATLSANYTVSSDANNPSRVFVAMPRGRLLEFSIDYSKPLEGANGSWTLVKNWTYGLPANVNGYVLAGFRGVSTLSNGRTYALMRYEAPPIFASAVVELPASGHLRFTGQTTSSTYLQADGSLRFQELSGNTHTFKRQVLTGFNGSHNPVWSPASVIATAPAVRGVDPRDGSDSGGPRTPITSNNKLIFFDNTKNGGMHLGGIDLSGAANSWAWKAAPSIPDQRPLRGDGSYDNGTQVNYAGAMADSSGPHIVFGYKGENWNNSQANQLMHYYDNGLFVGQFGTPGDGRAKHPPGAAGNIMSPFMVAAAGKTYLYTNDEGKHAGLHRWRFDGVDTVAVLSGTGTLGSRITLSGSAPGASVPTIDDAPPQPTGFTATPTSGSVFLQWDATPGATYYQLRRSSGPNPDQDGYQIIATGLFENSFSDRAPLEDTTAHYAVVPVSAGGAGIAAYASGVSTPGTTIYEAEDGILVNTHPRPDPWASGGFQTANTNTGSVTLNNVDGGVGGFVTLIIRYSFGGDSNWSGAALRVNGTNVGLLPLPPTGGWQGGATSPYSQVTLNIALNAGATNTLVLSRGPCLDKFTVITPVVAPSITAQPADQTVSPGQRATFTVGANGVPSPTYQWRKGTADISGATSASYTTPVVTDEDNGTTFNVVVRNSSGSLTSSSATLTVTGHATGDNSPSTTSNLGLLPSTTITGSAPAGGRGLPGDILYNPLTNAYVNQTSWNEYGVAFNQNLGKPDETAAFTWQASWPSAKNINYITIGGCYPNQPQPNTMWKVQYRFAGTWTTIAEGKGGWINGGIFSWGGLDHRAVVADAVRVIAYSDGTHDLVSIHLRGRGGLSGGIDDRSQPTKATLIQYLASGSVPPTIATQPASQTVHAGQSAVFTVSAIGTPAPSYQWRKNGAPISGATAATYTKPATTLDDSLSTYSVVVSNPSGSVTSNAATLTVTAPPASGTPKVILDTDIGPDVDDVGAVAVLHALADAGECEILGMMVSARGHVETWGAPCLDALNTFYNRPNIPIGTNRRTAPEFSSNFNQQIAEEFPQDIGSGANAWDAVDLYRKLLSEQPDASVTIISIGFLSNLEDLLRSGPDGWSPLSGVELVAQKVRLWSCMGGKFPLGFEFNFERHGQAAHYAVTNWPTKAIFSGWDIGASLPTGAGLAAMPTTNPVRRGYELYTGLADRASWDQSAVLAGVRGVQPYWATNNQVGSVKVKTDGHSNWDSGVIRDHAYLIESMPPAEVASIIEDLMLRPPGSTQTQPLTFASWVGTITWGSADQSASGDPDGDGIVNFLEYAFGGNPLVADSYRLPQTEPTEDGTRLALTLSRNSALTTLTYEVQGTNNLTDPWQTIAKSTNGGAFVNVEGRSFSVTEDGAGSIKAVTVTDGVLISETPHRFLQLRVTGN